jgi:hypothetical protein
MLKTFEIATLQKLNQALAGSQNKGLKCYKKFLLRIPNFETAI